MTASLAEEEEREEIKRVACHALTGKYVNLATSRQKLQQILSKDNTTGQPWRGKGDERSHVCVGGCPDHPVATEKIKHIGMHIAWMTWAVHGEHKARRECDVDGECQMCRQHDVRGRGVR